MKYSYFISLLLLPLCVANPTIDTQTELVGRKGQVQPQPQVMEHNDVDRISPVAKNLF